MDGWMDEDTSEDVVCGIREAGKYVQYQNMYLV